MPERKCKLARIEQVLSARALSPPHGDVILGDQLDPNAPAIAAIDPETDAVVMMEVKEESTHVASHRQRTALFLSSMRHYALELQEQSCTS